MRWRILFLSAAVCCGVFATSARAQVKIPEEYEKTVKATQVIGALGADLFGESTSFYTGATTFSTVDVSLPGNSGLPVEIRRSFAVQSRATVARGQVLGREGSFGEWDLDIPYLHGIFILNRGWQVMGGATGASDRRCSLSDGSDPQPPNHEEGWEPHEYWYGNSLHMPGAGDQEMLFIDPGAPSPPTDGKTYVWVTHDRWYFSCLPDTANGIAGDAFLAVDPQGNRYYFDWFVKRITDGVKRPGTPANMTQPSEEPADGSETPADDQAPSETPAPTDGVAEPSTVPVPGWIVLPREQVRIYPTKIEDRFGNSVTYTYDATKPWRLLSIVANDGRSLTLSYNTSGQITSVTDGTRTWTYIYGDGLTEVRLPDQSKWLIDFSDVREAYTFPDTVTNQQCEKSGARASQNLYVGTITHPSGAVGEFQFRSLTHGRSYVPKRCVPGTPEPPTYADHADVPYLFNTVALLQKKITGPGIVSPSIWTYTYGTPNNSWLENCSGGCTSSKTVEVNGPTGDWTRYTFGNRYKYNEGKLLKVEKGNGPTSILSTETTTYQYDATGMAYRATIGQSWVARGDNMAEYLLPVVQRTHLQQGRTFTWEVASSGCSPYLRCFDAYARPTKVVKSSAP